MPLVGCTASLKNWLQPGFDAPFRLVPDLDGIEALSEDRASLWKRVSEAEFLSDEEKRQMVGVATRPSPRCGPHGS